jgi:hypothetical protein
MSRLLFVPKYASALLLFALTVFPSRPSFAQVWVASTGTVDTSSTATVQFKGGDAYVLPSVNSGSVVLRYNVLPAGKLLTPLSNPGVESRALVVRFLDNGSAARVVVKLKSYNVHTGLVTTLLSFDSNNFPPQAGFQEHIPTISDGNFFNFSFADGPTEGPSDEGGDSAYYIEATLTRTAPGGTPGLATIRIVTVSAP